MVPPSSVQSSTMFFSQLHWFLSYLGLHQNFISQHCLKVAVAVAMSEIWCPESPGASTCCPLLQCREVKPKPQQVGKEKKKKTCVCPLGLSFSGPPGNPA